MTTARLMTVPRQASRYFVRNPGAATSESGPRQPLSVAIYMHDLTGGGVERQTLSLANALQRLGVLVTLVLHQARGPLLQQIPVDLEVVNLQSRRTLEDVPRLAAYLRRYRPDILLANLDHNNVAALLAKALAGGKTKAIICQHNSISPDFNGLERWTYGLIPLAYRLLSPLATKAIAVSEGLNHELCALAGVRRDKIVTINNPVVGPDFAARASAHVDHPWFDVPGQPLFVTAGRFVMHKDHATLLRALALHRGHTPSRLLVLGSGPLFDDVRALADELGLADAIAFLGFQDNPLPYFRRADAFVLSSRSEGFGNVLVEALACGTPVISTDCPHGPREILDHGSYGSLVPVQDPVALAAAMDDLPALRLRCPTAQLQKRAEAFTYEVCAMRYLELFRSLVAMRQTSQ